MNGLPQKATLLSEVPAAMDQEPLPFGDPRYVDLSKGRGSDELSELGVYLRTHDASANRFAKAAFTGHRGCGKTTELLRVMHDLRDQFTPMHVVASDALIADYDYTDLFLWLTDQLVGQFRDEFGAPLDKGLVQNTGEWFAAVTKEVAEDVKTELTVSAEAEGGMKLGWFGIGLKLLARLKSMVKGSVQRRTIVRQQLQRYSTDLVARVNQLLDDAHRKLQDAGKPPNLLIVVDNLDRLSPDVGRRLFWDNGDWLKQLRAHVIYTVPIAPVLAPMDIGKVFDHKFTLPIVRVREPDGVRSRKGLGTLMQVLDQRLDREQIFTSRGVARLLAEMSGGSMRDFIRLVQNAWLTAEAAGKQKIDKPSAQQAVTKLRIDYQRILIPGQIYYPLLAKVHQTHRDWFEDADAASAEKVDDYRQFFSQLLFNGAVLEYNGADSWYDVHPVIEDIDGFRKALSHAEADQPAS